MKPMSRAFATVVTSLVTIAVNYSIVRFIVGKVGKPADKRRASFLSLGIAVFLAIPTVVNGLRFAEIAEQSTKPTAKK
jgi:hypothetical protein